jgi:hypothetical protein
MGLSFTIASGQTTHTEYFMRSSSSKMYLNPAKRPDRGYIGIPGLNSVQMEYRTNTFGIDNFLFPGWGENGKSAWFLNQNVSYERFMEGISPQNYVNMDMAYTPIGFGFYIGKLFLAFDAGLKINTDLNIPEGVFRFLKKGISLGEEGTGESYDFSDISVGGTVYVETGVGASFPLFDNSLIVGAKVKLLGGLVDTRFNIDRMVFNAGKDRWTLSTQASAHIAGIPVTYDDENKFEGLDSDNLSLGINGIGLGLDLGITFTPGNSGFTFSAALTDIGSIAWDDQYATYLKTDPQDMLITGDHNISYENNSDNFLSDIVDNLRDDFANAIALKADPDAKAKKTTDLVSKLNLGVEYAFLDKQMNVGVLSSTYYHPLTPWTEITLAGAYRPGRALEVGVSYSFLFSKFETFGLAVQLGPIFVAGDYIVPHFNSDFIPTTMRAFNMRFGLRVPIGPVKH